jgi:hypothetical protein
MNSKKSKTKIVKKSANRYTGIYNNKKKAQIKKHIKKNRSLIRKLILHPFSIFLILCFVVFTIDWTFQVLADSYSIQAEILAPILEVGATITSPTDHEILTSAPIAINGTCPDNSYVNIYINNLFSGTNTCTDQTFTIPVDLFAGDNNIIAKDFNVTNQQGPSTAGIIVVLNLPVVANSGNNTLSTAIINPSESSVPAAPTLVIESTYYYQTFTAGNTYSWEITLDGGQPPYTLLINWGDNTTSKLIFNTDPTFKISHKYSNSGYYNVIIKASDAINNTRTLQLSALIKQPGSPTILGNTKPTPTPVTSTTNKSISLVSRVGSFFKSSKQWLWAAWTSIIIVILMLISFLLGEREQKSQLLKKNKPNNKK